MKNFLIGSLLLGTLLSSTAFAGTDELLEKLDEKGLKIALRAVTKRYQVNWRQFNFNDKEDNNRANQIHDYLLAVVKEKADEYFQQFNAAPIGDPNAKLLHKKIQKYDEIMNQMGRSFWNR